MIPSMSTRAMRSITALMHSALLRVVAMVAVQVIERIAPAFPANCTRRGGDARQMGAAQHRTPVPTEAMTATVAMKRMLASSLTWPLAGAVWIMIIQKATQYLGDVQI